MLKNFLHNKRHYIYGIISSSTIYILLEIRTFLNPGPITELTTLDTIDLLLFDPGLILKDILCKEYTDGLHGQGYHDGLIICPGYYGGDYNIYTYIAWTISAILLGLAIGFIIKKITQRKHNPRNSTNQPIPRDSR